ncbi:RidA family protein [Bulleidia sp. zg-1006]|uniref:RidA family protein n=1 Tax=Bulleidia sp. zg-1006 TaxID=2806552 RepID=UPI00193A434E|nr:RidA family protein [Bulleidia sp. zg-1006]QRG87339.1 RidA family protein [Bulleidia sp. zg-1006]
MIQESIQPKKICACKNSSSAIKSGDSIYIAAQLPMDENGRLIAKDIESQVERCLKNMDMILKEAGLGVRYVLTTRVYLVNMEDLYVVDKKMAGYFKEPYPARTVLGVSALPCGALVQIEAFAMDTRAIEILMSHEDCSECSESVCEVVRNIH